MSVPELLKAIGDGLHASASVRSVFGDVVSQGDRTVIPVARIQYGFGGGGGPQQSERGSGGGGGGHISAVPAGVIEITPKGTRFVSCDLTGRFLWVAGIGFVLGVWVGRLRKG